MRLLKNLLKTMPSLLASIAALSFRPAAPASGAEALTPPVTMRVTAYCLQGRTAQGTWVHPGTVAAYWPAVPQGTELWIEGYGYGIVEDTGGVIWTGRLDIWYNDCAAARRWGVRYVSVWVLE